ncbi:hypothetical protein CI610_01775 [invertebrate metagenome]|uniref:Uncharacterized protein n=1 Tax=invertebrate metagenome TaxID=1711999 RepID=A0A2H9T7R3_9ZZZZ
MKGMIGLLGIVLFFLGIFFGNWLLKDTLDLSGVRWYRPFNMGPWVLGDDREVLDEGTYEVSRFDPQNKPDKKTIDQARLFRQQVKAAVIRNGWDDVEKARADGFINGPPFDYIHFYNPEFAADGRILDPETPEFLMFYPTAQGGYQLGGAMFLTQKLYDEGEQFGEQLTYWHFHITAETYCWRNNIIVEREEDGSCHGRLSRRSPEMLNVWLVDHPQGAFATEMCLPSGLLSGWEGQKSWDTISEERYDTYRKIFDSRRYLPAVQ